MMLENMPSLSAAQSGKLGTGLALWTGVITEEWDPALRTLDMRMRVYREMMRNVIIGTLLEALSVPLVEAQFGVEPAKDSGEKGEKAAEFLKTNMDSMRGGDWLEHVEEMLDFLPFGFSLAEIVLEKKDDGNLHLRTLLPVAQETTYKWGPTDDDGYIKWFQQRDPITGRTSDEVPMSRILHFINGGRKRNPEGLGILRSVYEPWFYVKNLQVIEAMGAERDIGNSPLAVLAENVDYTDAQITALGNSLKAFRADQNSYMIAPFGVDVRPFGAGGKVYNTREMIRDYKHDILRRYFADFLSLGSEQGGAGALAREMTSFFSLTIQAIQRNMLQVWNRQMVPYLFNFNPGMIENPGDQNAYPKITWDTPGKANIQMLATALSTLIDTGILQPDDDIEDLVRRTMGLPDRPEDKTPDERLDSTQAGREMRQAQRDAPEGNTNDSPRGTNGNRSQAPNASTPGETDPDSRAPAKGNGR